ncbi:MAG: hypothetical protein ACI4DU_05775 [Lachnospiraceae bacterium]
MANPFESELSKAKSKEELEQLKHQLFLENVRIQAEKSQLENEYENLRRERKTISAEKKQLVREKRQLKIELSELKEQVEYERKRLKDDEILLEKKQRIIEHSYELMGQDQAYIQREKDAIEKEKEAVSRMMRNAQNVRKEVYATGIFFRGVNNQIALKKRYKELLKIYHPDNICGDGELLMKINKEYEELSRRFEYGKQA